jgi:hypothetical protein
LNSWFWCHLNLDFWCYLKFWYHLDLEFWCHIDPLTWVLVSSKILNFAVILNIFYKAHFSGNLG